MALVVFDASVLIGFLNRSDPHNVGAVERLRASLVPGTARWICATTLTEILIGPLRAGRADVVEQMLVRFSIETKQVDMALAKRAAAVRVRTGLKLPDAYVLATAIHAEKRGHRDVRIETFDERLRAAHATLHPYGSDAL